MSSLGSIEEFSGFVRFLEDFDVERDGAIVGFRLVWVVLDDPAILFERFVETAFIDVVAGELEIQNRFAQFPAGEKEGVDHGGKRTGCGVEDRFPEADDPRDKQRDSQNQQGKVEVFVSRGGTPEGDSQECDPEYPAIEGV